jgi:hypothetical protein
MAAAAYRPPPSPIVAVVVARFVLWHQTGPALSTAPSHVARSWSAGARPFASGVVVGLAGLIRHI